MRNAADPKLDLAQNAIGVWQGVRLVAYALVYKPELVRGVLRFETSGAVDPAWRRRGLGTEVIGWMRMRMRMRAMHAECGAEVPGELLLTGAAANAGLAALTEGMGFTPCRYWFTMSRVLCTAPVRGAAVVPISLPMSTSPILRPPDTGPAPWATSAPGLPTGARARPAHCWPARCRPPGRQRYDRAELVVDTANPTGALGLYKSLSFVADRKLITYAGPLAPS
ncbi:hypothetical protein [Streptomyces sp. NPDC048644]|uniref:hypothetical protein n=1 Tax=Streptomyces sp. NPDC048644 TaxID=3365582 RepID=UPI0037218FC9